MALKHVQTNLIFKQIFPGTNLECNLPKEPALESIR